MRRIVIPCTQLQTSRLGFGTASLHRLFRSRERTALLGAAMDAGFTHFDTAPMYGEGMAERELGRYLQSTRHRVTIATKIGLPAIAPLEYFPPLLYAHRSLGPIGRRLMPSLWNYRPRSLLQGSVEKSLIRSLRALRTEWIDLLLIHEPQAADIGSLLTLAAWLTRQKSSGRVRYLGLAGSASNCLEVAREAPGLFDVLQVEDSLADFEAEVVIKAGWPLQITFGYLRDAIGTQSGFNALDVIKGAMARNARGLILVSTRQPGRLEKLAACAASEGRLA